MSLESLRATARTLTNDQLTAGMVVGLQWAVQYIDDELFNCLADDSVDKRDIRVMEIMREWLAEISNGMVSGVIQIGSFEVGSIHD